MNEMHNLNVHCIFTYSSYVEVGRPTFFRLILEQSEVHVPIGQFQSMPFGSSYNMGLGLIQSYKINL